jgi:type I restriction enzyme S subunit
MAKTLETTKVRGWKRYPSKQPLSLDWPMEIPDHWRSHRLKEVADARPSNVDKKTVEGDIPVQLCNYVDVYKNRAITADMDFMQATATPSQVEQFSIHADDVIITKDSEAWDDIGVPAHVPNVIENLVCGYHLTLVRPNPQKLLGAYLARCFESEGLRDQFCVAANGVTRYGLGTQEIKCFVLPVPPISEQRAIVAFLGRETERIDALIARKQRLIELLEEKRQAVISKVVTNGLNPSVRMKDSKVKWLKEIPELWSTLPLKFLVDLKSGEGITGESISDAGDYPVYGGNGFRGFTSSYTHDGHFVLIGRQGAHCGNINYAEGKFWASEHAVVATPKREFDTVWLGETLRAMDLNQYSMTAAQPGLSMQFVGNLRVPFPPLDEQQRLRDFMQKENEKLEAVRIKLHISIEKLQEYRTALISAAVTGQIDIRDEVELDG